MPHLLSYLQRDEIKLRWWIPFGLPRKKWIPFITYAGFPPPY